MAKVQDAYAKAGVNVGENDRANDVAVALSRLTWNDRVISNMEGLFSGGYRIDKSKTGVIGQAIFPITNRHRLEHEVEKTIRRMCERGDRPLFMLDYLGFGVTKAEKVAEIMLRIIKGLERAKKYNEGAQVPIIGGEIAEMPGVIRENCAEIVLAITYEAYDRYHTIDTWCVPGDIITGSIDSVGTKTKLGMQLGMMKNLFYDMIGHSVGDISVMLAEPLGMAMYVGSSPRFAKSGLKDPNKAIYKSGLLSLCDSWQRKEIYVSGQFDIVGSIIGIVDEKDLLTGRNIVDGDRLIGYMCFGLNTNGYSLVRKLERDGLIDYGEKLPGSNLTVGQALMVPHENYLKIINAARNNFGPDLKGIAHITGGGIEANTKRLLPKGLRISIEYLPNNPLFKYLQTRGNLTEDDMNRTFNRGIGLVLVVGKDSKIPLTEDNYLEIGKVIAK